eukprot:NODE_1837_length_1052_cov_372.232698.p1 GENE.NODE_1837_length_1052_cov_372.232698~~NODE_1837_length_1052_cov_372.232698.p1  ORF type:complete len:311 (+),score=91.97 NODE_1837_length_1052_cov_372.232698:28-933(+)
MLIGGIWFLLGGYLMCIAVINIGKKLELNPFKPFTHIARARKVGLSIFPYLTSLSTLIGALLYGIGLVTDLVPELSASVTFIASDIPFLIGGFFFLLAFISEAIEADVLRHPVANLATGGLLANGVGSVLFFLAGFFNICSFVVTGYMLWGVGSIGYVLTAVIDLLMWQDEQFGLLFSSQLTALGLAMKDHAGDKPDRFSLMSIVMVVVHCIISVTAVAVFFCEVAAVSLAGSDTLTVATRAFYPLFICIFVHMVLAARVVMTRYPEEQPWRSLYMAMDVLALFGSANLFVRLLTAIEFSR